MTPKEKARELFDKYFELVNYPTPNWKSVTKQCALIAVKEILNEYSNVRPIFIFKIPPRLKYWQKVKQEIENL
jgi:hypothetical protein